MHKGEFLTRASIWITIVLYAIGSVIFAVSGKRTRLDSVVRIAWTVACLSLVVHFISAFQFYHSWSHTLAYLDTARQTKAVFGLDWGGGLFINYAILLLWIVDITWWWASGINSYRRRPWPLIATWHGILIFIIFNATVVFAQGIVRWLGLAICVGLLISWILVARQRWIGVAIDT